MKIADIISKLPLKVKLNNNFTLDDCYKVYVSAVVKSIDNYPFMDKSLYFSRSNVK